SFQAWRLAFNISPSARTPDERWMWVSAGLSLLRDEGIPLNPLSFSLHQDLAWFYWVRLATPRDDLHWYYKRRHALEWQEILGAPPEGAPERAVVEGFRAIASSPRDEQVLFEEDPSLEEDVAGLKEAFQGSIGELLEEASRIQGGEAGDEGLRAWLEEPGAASRRARWIDFLRARRLREELHLDPLLMLDLMERIGPLDWRHPASHAIYWSAQGALRSHHGSRRVRLRQPQDLRLVLRQHHVQISLGILVESGRMLREGSGKPFLWLPDPRFLEPLEDSYRAWVEEPDGGGGDGDVIPLERVDAYAGLLGECAVKAFLFGDSGDAARFHGRYRRLVSQVGASTVVEADVEGFVLARLREVVDRAEDPAQGFTALLVLLFRDGVASDRPEVASRYRDAIVGLHGEAAEGGGGSGLPPFGELELAALRIYLLLPPVEASPPAKARVWRRLREGIRRSVYPQVGTYLEDQARRLGLDPAELFPPPE
ncbi:MAG: hypothetical protein ACE5GW_07810, partial [Planctomycetota bacterium]